ncbi:transcriptional regulator [Micromonospora sp. WMMA1996]|uniref:transcriptional regulator n=1 Tax=Micromonospora sp. WMMA1996 TaxID=2039878 RepID=UPI0020D276E7|nr:transcriptional regulator [Micromonospora sp. WMMA1996]
MIPSSPSGPRLLGPLLVELRSARGWSQQRVAAELCAASGVPTLTRHEVSRWERQVRLPGDFWSAWLATVLGVPGELIAEAAARSRRLGVASAAVDPAGSRARFALLTLAHRWAADPTGGTSAGSLGDALLRADPVVGVSPTAPEGPDAPPGGARPRAAPDAPPDGVGLAALRRWDDLLGGGDLAVLGARRLRRAARGYRLAGPAGRRRLLPVLAESAQLAGWLAADAGDPAAGLVAYRLALRAALAAGDRPLAAYVLGSASHLLADAGDPAGALTLARIGYAAGRATASAGLRALLLHRVALAAALAGRHRAADRALAGAAGAGTPEPGREPPWLYWLDEAELAAMTGRTLVAAGRPARAVPLLARAATVPGRPRRAAVYGSWLARAHLRLGEVPEACEVASAALLDAVRSGSHRAVGQLTEFRRALAARPSEPAARRYAGLTASARPYLPGPAPGWSGEARARRAHPTRRAARRGGGAPRRVGSD